ncbi:MAG: hypothetical protein PWP39_528 [Pyrococcus sp.]|nr:hypothetical protein [Pyrococcus sp.]
MNLVAFIGGNKPVPALLREYRKVFDKLLEERFTIVFLFGIERWSIIRDEEVQLVNALETFLGDTRRIAFYFVNKDILSVTSLKLLYLLEELATTIIEFKKEEKRKLVVTKALNRVLEGYEVEL